MRIPTRVDLFDANMNLFVESNSIAQHMMENDIVPSLQLGNKHWSWEVLLQLQYVKTNSEQGTELQKQQKAKNKDILQLTLAFSPPRIAWRVDARIGYEIRKNKQGGTLRNVKILSETLLRDCGGKSRGIMGVLIPADDVNRSIMNGSQITSFYVSDLGEGGAVPTRLALDLVECLKNGSALTVHDTFAKLRLIGEPTITQLSALGMEEERIRDPIDMQQAQLRLETHLYDVGPVYIMGDTNDGQSWTWPGQARGGAAAPDWKDLGPLGDVISADGVEYTDIRHLFSNDEISFSEVLVCLKQSEGVVYDPSGDILGPNKRPIYTLYHILRNVYSSETKVEEMDEDPAPRDPPPPADPRRPPPGGGNSKQRDGNQDQDPAGAGGSGKMSGSGNAASGMVLSAQCVSIQRLELGRAPDCSPSTAMGIPCAAEQSAVSLQLDMMEASLYAETVPLQLTVAPPLTTVLDTLKSDVPLTASTGPCAGPEAVRLSENLKGSITSEPKVLQMTIQKLGVSLNEMSIALAHRLSVASGETNCAP
jgi:hypothetical protein